jgi:hypothetical protein
MINVLSGTNRRCGMAKIIKATCLCIVLLLLRAESASTCNLTEGQVRVSRPALRKLRDAVCAEVPIRWGGNQ